MRYLILETLLSEYSMTEEDNGVKWARRELARLDALTQYRWTNPFVVRKEKLLSSRYLYKGAAAYAKEALLICGSRFLSGLFTILPDTELMNLKEITGPMNKKMMIFLRCTFLLYLLFTLSFSSCALADPIGFGMVNASDVAIRKEAGGSRITRLPKGTSVWIMDSASDSRGDTWYHVRAQESTKTGYPVRKGWIKAEFVDAGSRLWNNIQYVKTASFGMIALTKDGTVLCAGDYALCDPQELDRYSGLKDIGQIGFTTIGCGFFAVDGQGNLYRNDVQNRAANQVRLTGSTDFLCITRDNTLQCTYEGNIRVRWICPQEGGETALSRVIAMDGCDSRSIFLTDDGKVFCAQVDDLALDYPEPDWKTWTDVVSIEASICSFGTDTRQGHTFRKLVPAFAAVRRDGTVLAAPESLAALTADWRDIRKTAIGPDWILGLKKDGTVIAAGIDGHTPPDLSAWTDLVDISTGNTFCVGVKRDGSLVFAGDFLLSDD